MIPTKLYRFCIFIRLYYLKLILWPWNIFEKQNETCLIFMRTITFVNKLCENNQYYKLCVIHIYWRNSSHFTFQQFKFRILSILLENVKWWQVLCRNKKLDIKRNFMTSKFSHICLLEWMKLIMKNKEKRKFKIKLWWQWTRFR